MRDHLLLRHVGAVLAGDLRDVGVDHQIAQPGGAARSVDEVDQGELSGGQVLCFAMAVARPPDDLGGGLGGAPDGDVSFSIMLEWLAKNKDTVRFMIDTAEAIEKL